MNMNDLPLLINTTPANPMNYNYQNLNYNIISYPQIQQTINSPIQKQSIDKPNNNCCENCFEYDQISRVCSIF